MEILLFAVILGVIVQRATVDGLQAARGHVPGRWQAAMARTQSRTARATRAGARPAGGRPQPGRGPKGVRPVRRATARAYASDLWHDTWTDVHDRHRTKRAARPATPTARRGTSGRHRPAATVGTPLRPFPAAPGAPAADGERPAAGPTVRPHLRVVDPPVAPEPPAPAGDTPAEPAPAPPEPTGGPDQPAAAQPEGELMSVTTAPSGEITTLADAITFTEKMTNSCAQLAAAGQNSMESLTALGMSGELVGRLTAACEALQQAGESYTAARAELAKHLTAGEAITALGDDAADRTEFYRSA